MATPTTSSVLPPHRDPLSFSRHPRVMLLSSDLMYVTRDDPYRLRTSRTQVGKSAGMLPTTLAHPTSPSEFPAPFKTAPWATTATRLCLPTKHRLGLHWPLLALAIAWHFCSFLFLFFSYRPHEFCTTNDMHYLERVHSTLQRNRVL